jgi:uncharacterized coiled-coil protein SlyX
MNSNIEAKLAALREATVRADDTIEAQGKAITAQELTIQAQRTVIDLLHAEIGRMEREIVELRAAL